MAEATYEIKKFNLDDIDIRAERSKYPFDQLEVGEGFVVERKVSSISGRVSAENKKGDKMFVTRTDKDSTPANPITNVIRTK